MSSKTFKQYLSIGVILIAFYWLLHHMNQFGLFIHQITQLIMPFIIGAVIAFILNVPMKEIEKHLFTKPKWKKLSRFRRLFAFLITFIVVAALITLALFVIIPEVINAGTQLMIQIPNATDEVIAFLERTGKQYPDITKKVVDIINNFELDFGKLMDMGVTNILSTGIAAVSSVLYGFVNFFIGMVFAVYILFDKDKLGRQCKKLLYKLLSKKRGDRILYIMELSNSTFSNFLRGQCLEAVILGSMFCVVMLILRLPYAFLIGILIAFTALIPIVGAFIGCALGAFFIAMVNPIQALAFIVMFLVLQQVEGNFIYPHVVGNSIGLPGIWVLVAVTIGGKLFGIMGMLVFIPICSVCYALLRAFVNKKEEEKVEKTEEKKENKKFSV